MRIFHQLRVLREFQRRHLPFLKTVEDLELVREIGIHQFHGKPLTLKLLLLQGIGSAATVQRRLGRLKRLGVVHQARASYDKRVMELTISPRTWRIYERLGVLMLKTR